MKVVQGPLKPLEVGQYHHRQQKFMQIQYVKIVCAETWQLKYCSQECAEKWSYRIVGLYRGLKILRLWFDPTWLHQKATYEMVLTL